MRECVKLRDSNSVGRRCAVGVSGCNATHPLTHSSSQPATGSLPLSRGPSVNVSPQSATSPTPSTSAPSFPHDGPHPMTALGQSLAPPPRHSSTALGQSLVSRLRLRCSVTWSPTSTEPRGQERVCALFLLVGIRVRVRVLFRVSVAAATAV